MDNGMKGSKVCNQQHTHQWMLTLYLTWLTTFTSTVSSSLATKVGPGNLPLTVTMGFSEHSLVVFFITTCMKIKQP
jgi:hypothetical protein